MTNFAEGTLKQTAAPWDMAIRGDGFFVVENDGQQFLTRAGNFQVNADGVLMTQQGYRVLSAAGACRSRSIPACTRYCTRTAISSTAARVTYWLW